MRRKQRRDGKPVKAVVEIRCAIREHYSATERIRIVLESLCSEDSIAALCRREGIPPNVYQRWFKDFLDAGKRFNGLLPWNWKPLAASQEQVA